MTVNNGENLASVRAKINSAIETAGTVAGDISALQGDVSAIRADVSANRSDIAGIEADLAARGDIASKTSAQWVSDNTILPANWIGVESDTQKFKIGDGATAWNSLNYWSEAAQQLLRVDTVTALGSYAPVSGTAAGMPLVALVNGVEDGIDYFGGGHFVWDADSTATADGYRVIQPTFNAGNPGRWKRVGNPSVYNVADWGVARSGDVHAALANMIDKMAAVDENPDGIGPWAFIGADIMAFPPGRYAVSQALEVPPTKNVLLKGTAGVGGTVLRSTASTTPGTDNWVLDYQPGGNCRAIGVENMSFEYGGIRLIGSQNWPITMRNFAVFGAPGTAVDLVDSADIGYSGPSQGGTRNVVHADLSYFQLAHNDSGLKVRASTYLLFRADKFTIRATKKTPLELDSFGLHLSKGHIMGTGSPTTNPMLHLAADLNANSHIVIDHVNFGSESFGAWSDQNFPSTIDNYKPAERTVVIGDLTTPASAVEGVANVTFRDCTFTGANEVGSESKVAIDLSTVVKDLTVDNCYVSDHTEHFIKETAAEAGLNFSTGRISNLRYGSECFKSTPAGKQAIMSMGGPGFVTQGFDMGNAARMAPRSAVKVLRADLWNLGGAAWNKTNCSVAQDATDRNGNANAAWTVTKTALGVCYLQTNNITAPNGPCCMVFEARSGTGRRIEMRAHAQANPPRRYTAEIETLVFDDKWRRYSINLKNVPDGEIPRFVFDLSDNDCFGAGDTLLVNDPRVLNVETPPEKVTLSGSITTDIPIIAAGAQTSRSILVTGARAGDVATVVSSISLGGIQLHGEVRADGVVTAVFTNPTGGNIDLASATYTALVTPLRDLI